MKFFLLGLGLVVHLGMSGPYAQAKTVSVDPIIKNDEQGKIVGCGVEFVASHEDATGIVGQIVLYNLGNLNWDLAVSTQAGWIDNANQFQSALPYNVSITNQRIGELSVTQDGQNVLKSQMNTVAPLGIMQLLLKQSFLLRYNLKDKEARFLEVEMPVEAEAVYREGCYNNIVEQIKEEYKKIHGDTRCLETPLECL